MTTENRKTGGKERVSRLLWSAAGAIHSVLEKCPTEHNKYAALGLLMIFIALLASVSFAFFLSLTFDIPFLFALPFGIVWGALIFCLDRVLLTSYRKSETGKISVIQRFLLTAALAVIIGEPVLMYFFQTEIELELAQNSQIVLQEARENAVSRFKTEIVSLEKANGEIRARTDALKKERDAKEQAVIAETEGRSKTGRAGFGVAAKQKETAFREAEAGYNEYKTESAEALGKNNQRLAEIRRTIEDETNRIGAADSQAKGVLARHKALLAIVRSDLGAALIYIPLIIALLFLETLPLTVKVFGGKKSVYDATLESEEADRIAEVEAAGEFRKEELKRSREMQSAMDESYRRIILNGEIETLTDADELRTAQIIRTEALNRIEREAFRRMTEDFDFEGFGDEIVVEIDGRDEYEFVCQLPKPARKFVTLETLGGDIRRIAAKVGKNLILSKAYSSLRQEITANLPLLPQLENDRKMILLFETAGET
jgi:hypothetical protein